MTDGILTGARDAAALLLALGLLGDPAVRARPVTVADLLAGSP